MGLIPMGRGAPSHAVPVGVTACPTQHTGTCSLTFPRGQPGGQRLARAAASRGAQSYEDSVVVVGGGIGGLATAAALHQVGIPVTVLEQADKPRKEGGAIALWGNALRALDALDAAQPIRDRYVLLQRVELCSSSGQALKGFHLDECQGAPHEFRGVDRHALLDALRAKLPKGMVQYGMPVTRAQLGDDGSCTLDTAEGTQIRAGLTIGADGARSKMCDAMGLPSPNFAGYAAYRGVADIGPGGRELTPLDTVRQCFGQGVRAGLYPLSPTRWYWFVCWSDSPDPDGRDQAARKAHVAELVASWGARCGISQAIEATPEALITRSRITDRWQMLGGDSPRMATLVGDAAHPMTPNLGQGGCCALEDAVVLARHLQPVWPERSKGSSKALAAPHNAAILKALRNFEKERKQRVLPISVRAHAMGSALQIAFPPVCALRNAALTRLPIKSFLNHTMYDCGTLQQPVAA